MSVALHRAATPTKVNPPGFVMESYNAIGAWQTTISWGRSHQSGRHGHLRRRQHEADHATPSS